MNDIERRDAALSVLHRYRQGQAGLAEDALAELTSILVAPSYKPSRLYAETVKVRCCSAISPCTHQQKFPRTVCETCHEATRGGYG